MVAKRKGGLDHRKMANGGKPKTARDGNAPEKPHSRDKALLYAAYRTVGATQEEAAAAAGMSVRQCRAWESSEWWSEVRSEAVSAHHEHLRALALRTVKAAVKEGDAKVACWLLERLEGETFGQRVDHTSGGQPLRVAVVIPDPRNAGFGGDGDGD